MFLCSMFSLTLPPDRVSDGILALVVVVSRTVTGARCMFLVMVSGKVGFH